MGRWRTETVRCGLDVCSAIPLMCTRLKCVSTVSYLCLWGGRFVSLGLSCPTLQTGHRRSHRLKDAPLSRRQLPVSLWRGSRPIRRPAAAPASVNSNGQSRRERNFITHSSLLINKKNQTSDQFFSRATYFPNILILKWHLSDEQIRRKAIFVFGP